MRRSMSGGIAHDRGHLSIWVWLFLIGLVIPLFIYVGPMRLSVDRIVLLIAFFPLLLFWLRGGAGRIRLPDICVVVICLWSSLSMVIMDGGLEATVEPIGILWAETLGAYLLGRCCIRTPEAFYAMVRLLFLFALVLLPFAIWELYTGPSPLLKIFRAIGTSYGENPNPGRLGLERVQGPFSHPIHFGVLFASLVGMFYYVIGYTQSKFTRLRNAFLALFLCFSSLSAGPLLAGMSQVILLSWDGIMKSVRTRWYIFAGLALLAYITIDLLSNRTPFHVIVSYLSFNASTAYNRILIWIFGSASIWKNPLFGIGLTGDWARPLWMSNSMDMFWIVPAVRHGVVVWIAYLALFFSIVLKVIYRSGLSDRINWYRTGYLCSMIGLFAVGWTVHFWEKLFVFFMFMMASGLWILDWNEPDDTTDPVETTPRSIGYTRFPRHEKTSTETSRMRRGVSCERAAPAGGSERGGPSSLRQGDGPRAQP